MDLENIKNIWEKEEILETPEISIEKQKEIFLPLEKIRSNMRFEFWSSVFVFVVSLSVSWFSDIPFKLKLYVIMLILAMIMVTCFYYFRFFRLYKEIGNPMLKTYESLKDLLHQFELNKQYYISFYISFIPFLVAEVIIIQEFSPSFQFHSDMIVTVNFIFMVFLGLFLMYVIGKLCFKSYYGKHIKKIENLMSDLKD